MVVRFTDYDAFARMYDRHWGSPGARHLAILDRHVLPRLETPARILDLCCGTGQLAAILAERGHDVTGLDGSDEMLDRARTNAPAARFVAGDARDFTFPAPFDAVLCMFDSLNHVMTESELGAVFGCVRRVLVAGGFFAFDLNLEAKYRETWTGDFQVIDDDQVGVIRCTVDHERRRGLFDATLFYRADERAWRRHDLHLEQTWYDEVAVERLLGGAGFAPPETHAKERWKRDPDVALNRLYVTARREDPDA